MTMSALSILRRLLPSRSPLVDWQAASDVELVLAARAQDAAGKAAFVEIVRRHQAILKRSHILYRSLQLFLRAFCQRIACVADGIHPVTNHREVIPGTYRQPHGFFEPVLIVDRAHIQVVRHDKALEFYLFAKKACYDSR